MTWFIVTCFRTFNVTQNRIFYFFISRITVLIDTFQITTKLDSASNKLYTSKTTIQDETSTVSQTCNSFFVLNILIYSYYILPLVTVIYLSLVVVRAWSKLWAFKKIHNCVNTLFVLLVFFIPHVLSTSYTELRFCQLKGPL